MTSDEALLTVHKMQTNLWGIQESRSDKYKRNAAELSEPPEAEIIECPTCLGDGCKEYVCEWCGGDGCKMCILGRVVERCFTCKGKKEVLKYQDGHVEVLV